MLAKVSHLCFKHWIDVSRKGEKNNFCSILVISSYTENFSILTWLCSLDPLKFPNQNCWVFFLISISKYFIPSHFKDRYSVSRISPLFLQNSQVILLQSLNTCLWVSFVRPYVFFTFFPVVYGFTESFTVPCVCSLQWDG